MLADAKKCVALEWGMGDENCKDYVPCDETVEVESCVLSGLMLSVEVDLCQAHQKYFAKKPKGWGMVKLYDAKSCRRIDVDYRGKLYLMAEKLEAGA